MSSDVMARASRGRKTKRGCVYRASFVSAKLTASTGQAWCIFIEVKLYLVEWRKNISRGMFYRPAAFSNEQEFQKRPNVYFFFFLMLNEWNTFRWVCCSRKCVEKLRVIYCLWPCFVCLFFISWRGIPEDQLLPFFWVWMNEIRLKKGIVLENVEKNYLSCFPLIYLLFFN